MGNFVTTAPNVALVKSGCSGTSVHVGETTWKWWVLETVQKLSLKVMTLEVKSQQAETVQGVQVNLTSVAQVKVRAYRTSESGELLSPDEPNILKAATHFLGNAEEAIKGNVVETLEGHQRQILGTLTVEDLYKDRAAFSQKVRENVFEEFEDWGMVVMSYVITNVDDENDYLLSLGESQLAAVQNRAEEGKSRNESKARQAVAQYSNAADAQVAVEETRARVAKNDARELEAESDRNLDVKNARFLKEVRKAQQAASHAYDIEMARQNQAKIREESLQVKAKETVLAEITDISVARSKMERQGMSHAILLREQNDAKGITVTANANAAKIRALGQANAEVLRAKGEAEGEVLEDKAESFKAFGEAALTQMVLEKLPELAETITAPLANTEKLVYVSGGKKNKGEGKEEEGKASPAQTAEGAAKKAKGPKGAKGSKAAAARGYRQA